MTRTQKATGRTGARAVRALLAVVALVGIAAGATATGVSFINPYDSVDWDTYGQYKGNLHSHTTESDGASTPTERIDEYHSRGYGVLALTDHNKSTWSWNDWNRDPASLGMVAVQGSEPSRHHHIGSFFNGYDGSSSNIDTSLQTIGANGGLSMFYHPGRYSYDTQWYVDRYNAYPHLVGQEVYNQGDRYSGDRAAWDAVLTQMMPDRPVWGYSNDDSHTIGHVGRNTNFFLLPELTDTAVRNAMVEGHTYFSYTPIQDGAVPTIGSIDVDSSAGTISIAGDGYTDIRWISEGAQVAAGATFDYFAALAGSGDTYVRAELHGPTGITYTQPFGIEADGSGPPAPRSPFVEYTFQQGRGGYVGAVDTEIRSAAKDSSYGDRPSMSIDGDDGSPGLQPNHGLVKFGDIIGAGEGLIPAGATIDSASLALNVTNPGSGFDVLRMTADWSESTTWNDLGGDGITAGVDTVAGAVTQVGANNGSENVGRGSLALDVTSAMQAWADGENNYGLGMVPYVNGTNGIDFDTSEGSVAPLLTVRTLAEGVIKAEFADGADTLLMQSEATVAHGDDTSMSIDNNDPNGTGGDNHGLLMFDGVFGDGEGRIPAASYTEILKAELTLEGFNPGSGANFHRLLSAWGEDATWADDFGGDGVQADGVEAAAVADAFTVGAVGTVVIDVTASVQAWLADPSSNFGWALLPVGDDGWDFHTFEGAVAPSLKVYYAVPEPATMGLLALGGLLAAARRRRR